MDSYTCVDNSRVNTTFLHYVISNHNRAYSVDSILLPRLLLQLMCNVILLTGVIANEKSNYFSGPEFSLFNC